MLLLPVLRASLLCMPACIAWHHPLYRTVLRPLVPPGTSGPTLDLPFWLEVGITTLLLVLYYYSLVLVRAACGSAPAYKSSTWGQQGTGRCEWLRTNEGRF